MGWHAADTPGWRAEGDRPGDVCRRLHDGRSDHRQDPALAACPCPDPIDQHIEGAEAMNEDAPLLFEDMITRGVEPTPTKPSNISKRLEFKIGDLDAGWARADVIVEEEFKTAAVH